MKLSNVSKVVSLSEFRYGHDPAHYPIKGFYFVMSNPSLWRRVACVAFFGAFVAFLALVFLLVFALKPQAEAFGGGQWWSWLLAVLIVLLEAAIVTMLVVATAQSKCQTEVFCQTMKIKGYWREGEMKKQSICADLNLFKKVFYESSMVSQRLFRFDALTPVTFNIYKGLFRTHYYFSSQYYPIFWCCSVFCH